MKPENENRILDCLYGEPGDGSGAPGFSAEELREAEDLQKILSAYRALPCPTPPSGATEKALMLAESSSSAKVTTLPPRRFIFHPFWGVAALFVVVCTLLYTMPERVEQKTKTFDTRNFEQPAPADAPDMNEALEKRNEAKPSAIVTKSVAEDEERDRDNLKITADQAPPAAPMRRGMAEGKGGGGFGELREEANGLRTLADAKHDGKDAMAAADKSPELKRDRDDRASAMPELAIAAEKAESVAAQNAVKKTRQPVLGIPAEQEKTVPIAGAVQAEPKALRKAKEEKKRAEPKDEIDELADREVGKSALPTPRLTAESAKLAEAVATARYAEVVRLLGQKDYTGCLRLSDRLLANLEKPAENAVKSSAPEDRVILLSLKARCEIELGTVAAAKQTLDLLRAVSPENAALLEREYADKLAGQ
jgi:hypothetical protein